MHRPITMVNTKVVLFAFIISSLFADNLDQDPLTSSPVELPVEDTLPWPEIQISIRDSHNDLSAHDLPLQMRVSVVLPCQIVFVLADRFMGCEFLQPFLIVLVKSGFVVVDKHGCGDVHCVDENQTLPDAAFPEAFFYLRGNVDESPAGGYIEPELLAIAFH